MMRNRGDRWSALAAGLALLVAGCGAAEAPGIVANGTVEVREIDASPLAAGRVVEVLVDEGAAVLPGDTLVRLTAPTLDADLDGARARLASAEAQLRDLMAGARPQEIAGAAAELVAARAESARLERDRERVAALLAAGAVAQREHDQVVAAATVAAEQVRGAAERLSLLEAGSRPARVSAARAEVASARAALAGRQAASDEFVLVASVAGTVLSRVVEPGDLLAAGMPALVLGVMQEPWVRVYVPARALPSVALGGRAVIYPPGAGAEGSRSTGADSVLGRVIAINPRAEYVTRMALSEDERADLLFGVKVAIDDPANRYKPGMPVRVRILTDTTVAQ